ncbi:SET and MYND domain-containing protein 3 [Operophtera brumata]|uniref:SET and MYND domain-containing protein 3 n=1 Tax=Operophtera brumata TaxID=104452 RepID=A0A0L7LD79_OPEBR|nr:SET and MYND domain-containing protein 3 [Operophtera brumata]
MIMPIDNEEATEKCNEIKNEPFQGVRCDECGTKYTETHIDTFVKAMEFTELHLRNMQTDVDVCKFCLDRHEGVLHPMNVTHAQTLDHAFDALIQVQLWDQAFGLQR